MAGAIDQRTAVSYSCIAFVHAKNVPRLLCDKVSSAILLDSSCQQVVSGMLTCSGQDVVSRAVNWSSLCDAFDVSNGHTASVTKPAVDITHMQQDASDCSVSACNGDCRLLFMTPVKVFSLTMNAHLAGCIAKTVSLSSKFAHSFVNYARHCGRKPAVFPVHNVSFNVDAVSTLQSCADIPSSPSVPTEETKQNAVIIHQTVIVVMTSPCRHGIDYQWYEQFIH